MDMNLSKLKLVMHREVWRAAVHGITNSRMWLSELKSDWKLLISSDEFVHKKKKSSSLSLDVRTSSM